MFKHLIEKLDQLIKLFTQAAASLDQIDQRLKTAEELKAELPPKPRIYISIKEAARRYLFGVKSFYRWNKSGLYPAYYIGSHPVYDAEELDQWIRENKSEKHGCKGCGQ